MGLSRRRIADLLVQLGQLHADKADSDVRKDSGETAFFTRQLEFIISEVYRTEYPELRARDFIPLDSRVPSGALSFTWRLWDWRGMAKILSTYADDLPTVEILAAEKSQTIQSLGVGYTYTIQDVRSAQMANINLEVDKAEAARRAHEVAVDQIAAFGDVQTGLPGFLNNPNVPVISCPDPDVSGDWLNPATDPLRILKDLHAIVDSVRVTTKGVHAPDTMLLPLKHFDKLATTPMNQYQDKSILRAFLDSSPYIRGVDQWNKLDKADAAGTGPRVVCYTKNPRIVSLVIPQEFEQLPPQIKGLGFMIPCHSRIGGVTWRYPLAATYVDGVGT